MLKGRVDCLVTTVLAGGGSNAADAHGGRGHRKEWLEWEVPALEEIGVPVVQGICTTASREAWLASDAGLSPLDTAWQVAIPEFDGRIVGVPFSFKECVGNGFYRLARRSRVYADGPGADARAWPGSPPASRVSGGFRTRRRRIAVLLLQLPDQALSGR